MKTPFAPLFRSVLQWFRRTRRNPSRDCQSRARKQAVSMILPPEQAVQMPSSLETPPALSPEQFRRMLQKALAADPNLARRVLWPLVGTVFPIQGGTCTTDPKDVGPGAEFGANCAPAGNYSFPANLGIGTANPAVPLHVDKDQNAITAIRLSNPNTGAAAGTAIQKTTNSGGSQTINSYLFGPGFTGTTLGLSNANLALTKFESGVGDVLYQHAGTRSFNWSTYYGTEAIRMTLLASGNVGIGTTTPLDKLDVNGAMDLRGALRTFDPFGAERVKFTYDESTSLVLRDISPGSDQWWFVLTPNQIVQMFGGSANTAAAKLQLLRGNLTVDSGNVGIGTASPATGYKLDVIGNIKSDGLNKIVFLRAVGGSHDDGADINTAIANLTENGGIIYLLPGTTYNIKTTIRNGSKKSVKLRGFGGAALDGEVGPTILKWDTTSSESSKRVIELKSNTTGQHWDDFEISDVTIDGNANALTGVYLNAIASSKFVNVQIQNMNKRTSDGQTASIGFELTTSQGERNTMFNMFLNCSVWGADIGLKLTGGTNNGAANSCHNTFIGLNIGYYAKISTNAGISLGDCDNNCIIRPWIFPIPVDGVTAAPGVLVEKASPDSETVARHARANYFYHAQPAVDSSQNPTNIAFWIKQADLTKPAKNLVFGYDLENGQGQPRAWNNGTELSATDVKKFLFWIDSVGDIRGGQFA